MKAAAEPWAFSLFPRYDSELAGLEFAIAALAPESPTRGELWVACHLVMGMRRTVSGHRGLSILADWNRQYFGGNTITQMIGRTMVWVAESATQRRAAQNVMAEQVERVAVENPDAAAELDELRIFLADAALERCAPPADNLAWLPQTAAVRALRRSIRSHAQVYPMRYSRPLVTPEDIAAARPIRAVLE